MHFLGKIFVILQLVLSVLLMAFAGAAFAVHDSWKQKSTDIQASLDKKATDLKNVEAEFEKYKTETTEQLSSAKRRAELAETQSNSLTEKLQQLNERFTSQADELQRASALAKINLVEAKLRRDEALLQRDVNKSLHASRDEINRERQTLEDQLYAERIKNDEASEKQKVLLAKTAFYERVIRQNKLETDQRIYDAKTNPPPPVEGLVTETQKSRRSGEEFVAISIGSDDGLVPGHSLDVYRLSEAGNGGAKYLGKIQVIETEPDRAVGKVVEKAKNGVIQRGDNVTTKL